MTFQTVCVACGCHQSNGRQDTTGEWGALVSPSLLSQLPSFSVLSPGLATRITPRHSALSCHCSIDTSEAVI